MLRLLCKQLLQQHKQNPNPGFTPLHFSSPQTPFTTRTLTAATTTATATSDESLTVSYLINSCGLSPETALAAATRVHLKATENPDSVLRLLRDFGCTDSDVSTIITKRPILLSTRPDRTLRPKLEFLRESAGFSGPGLACLICTNPDILLRSLDKKLIPSFHFLKKILPSGGAMTDALKFSTRLYHQFQLPNLETLRRHGVPDKNIARLLVSRPGSLMRSPDRFEEIVVMVKEDLGLHPKNPIFPHAVGVMSFMRKSTWERKVEVYRSLGWSQDEIFTAFRKQPTCLGMSDERIRQKMEFYTKKLGWSPRELSRSPILMMIGFEKRVLPRCSVLNVLMKKGLVKRNVRMRTALMIPVKAFLERYVSKYVEEVPEVVDAHQGKVEFLGWDVEPDVTKDLHVVKCSM